MKKSRDSLIFYRSFFEAIKELDADVQANVYNAIFEYSLNFKEVELTGISKSIFTLIKPQLDANNKRYENGKKGGNKNQGATKEQPKSNQTATKIIPDENQKATKQQPNKNDNVNANENENENEKIKWQNFPKSDIIINLPESTINAAIEKLFFTKQIKIDRRKVIGMFSVFKSECLLGKKFYENESEVIKHFSNWIASQKFNNGKTNSHTAKQEYRGSQGLETLLHTIRNDAGLDG